jgi:ATP-dependent Clp protease ATP-binding subunit ClpA
LRSRARSDRARGQGREPPGRRAAVGKLAVRRHTGGTAGELPGSAFIGRADELRRLDAALERAERGRPQVVLLAGDAGVGKTRLLLALADRARRRPGPGSGRLDPDDRFDLSTAEYACGAFRARRLDRCGH